MSCVKLGTLLTELSDFLEADNFQQVLVKMEVSSKYRESAPACGNQQQQTPNVYDYKIEMLHTDVKEDVKRSVFSRILFHLSIIQGI